MDSDLKKTLQHTAVQHAAAQHTPVHHAPVYHEVVPHAGLHHAGIHHAPIHHTPIHHAPIHHAPIHHAPIHHAPIHHAPIHHAPIHHAPIHHAPIHHAPIHHAPIHHAPIHHAPIHHAPIHHAPIHHAGIHYAGIHHGVGQHTAAGYKSNQQLKRTRTQRDIKQATGPSIQYRSVTWRTLSDTVTVLEKKCESLDYRMSALETKAQKSRDIPLADDETEDTISECESYFEFINLENENDNDNNQSGQDYAKSCSSRDSSTSSHKERKLSDTFEERLFKNDTRVTKIKARIAKLLGDIDDVVRDMKETHEDITISSQQRFHGETIAPGAARVPAHGKFEGPAGVAGNHSG